MLSGWSKVLEMFKRDTNKTNKNIFLLMYNFMLIIREKSLHYFVT